MLNWLFDVYLRLKRFDNGECVVCYLHRWFRNEQCHRSDFHRQSVVHESIAIGRVAKGSQHDVHLLEITNDVINLSDRKFSMYIPMLESD